VGTYSGTHYPSPCGASAIVHGRKEALTEDERYALPSAQFPACAAASAPIRSDPHSPRSFQLFQARRLCVKSTGIRKALPRESSTIQKLLFDWRRIAAHRTISMRKSSEFDDYISMERCVLQQFRIAKCLVEPHAAILIGHQLGMHQR
jgi:hypothetical protein